MLPACGLRAGVALVLQGLSPAPLIGLLGIGDDGGDEREEADARLAAKHTALDRVRDLREQMKAHSRRRSRHMAERANGNGVEDRELIEHRLIRYAVTTTEREAVGDLPCRGEINAAVLRRIERKPDFDGLRMEG